LAHALHDYSGVLEKTYMHIVVATKQRTQTEACLKQFGSKSANIYKYYIKFNFDATFEYDFDATLFECTEFSGDITRPQLWETPLIRCICGLEFALQNTKAGKKQQFFGSSTYRMTLTDIIARTQFKNVMADLNKQPPPPIILSHDKRAGACGITPRAIVLGGNKRAISSMDEARDCTRLYSANKWCTASDYVEGGPTFDEQQTAIQQTMPNLVRTIFNALVSEQHEKNSRTAWNQYCCDVVRANAANLTPSQQLIIRENDKRVLRIRTKTSRRIQSITLVPSILFNSSTQHLVNCEYLLSNSTI